MAKTVLDRIRSAINPKAKPLVTAKTYNDEIPNMVDYMKPIEKYDTDFTNTDTYKALQSSLGGVSAAANPIDLSGIIADYKRNNQATIDTYNKTLNDTINTLRSSNEQSRNDLLTSLKRFQESNAENMRLQQQDFNSSRATLEDETFMNQRNAMANAASRGLGGSGLQQLAQLQNRISAGKDINTLAQKNQTVQDNLRKALSQEQEDYNTKVSNLEKNLANAIIQAQNDTASKINAANTNTTNLINNLIYNEQVRQRNAAAQAASARSNLSSLLAQMQKGVNVLEGSEKTLRSNLQNKIDEALNNKGAHGIHGLNSTEQNKLRQDLADIYNNYVELVNSNIAEYGIDSKNANKARSNLDNIYHNMLYDFHV